MDRRELKERGLQLLKKYRYAVLVIVLGIGLMMIPEKESTDASMESVQQTAAQPSMEERLTAILSQIKGAGRVSVMISQEAGEMVVYQQDEDSDEKSGKWDTVIVTDENRAQHGLIQQVIPPKYQGVVVVCQGADRASVRLSIIEAVSKITGLGTDRISVLTMK